MDFGAEIERMKASGDYYTERPGFYRRGSDGVRVRAVDWPNGNVSWLLDPPPVISLSDIVGTCTASEFARDFALEGQDGSIPGIDPTARMPPQQEVNEEMVDRVAKAIASALVAQNHKLDLDEDDCRSVARAAIEAMTPPLK